MRWHLYFCMLPILLFNSCVKRDTQCVETYIAPLNLTSALPDTVMWNQTINIQVQAAGRSGCDAIDHYSIEHVYSSPASFGFNLQATIKSTGCVCTAIAPFFNYTYTITLKDSGWLHIYCVSHDAVQLADSVFIVK